MKEIVVISGKGGTGKTSIAASLAFLGEKNIVVADCDVDAADMHLLLKPENTLSEDFYSGVIASIDQDQCTQCGMCKDVCRFDAISITHDKYIVTPLECEGCRYCSRICPAGAIQMLENKAGQWHIANTRFNNTLVHAKLGIGAENSGKLVAKVKTEAKRIAKESNIEYVVIDGSPGIGCPVVSSLSGASFVILVTEPTVSGLHDLKRVYELVRKFNIKAACIINKYDLNIEKTKEIIEFLKQENIVHLASLPYDDAFTDAMVMGKTIVELTDNTIKQLIEESWRKTIKLLNTKSDLSD